MLFGQLLKNEVAKRAAEFREHAERATRDIASYRASFDALAKLSPEKIAETFAKETAAGAFPAGELSANGSYHFEFGTSWQNHEQARRWAAEILDDRTTFAADGSQIYVGREVSIPVAAVQIGWFENPHNAEKPYEKNARFEVLTPADLFRDQEEPMNPDIRVEERRYLGEIAAIGDFLEKHRGWRERGERMPAAFFDNPLLVPFSQKGLQKSFVAATSGLVELSRSTGVPVVGYVARSFSRDCLSMLDAADPSAGRADTAVYDASLFQNSNFNWGDRSCFCYAKRRGLGGLDDPATEMPTVGFTYLQTARDSTPARLDIPVWVYESGSLDELADVVRAECVVGLGYPYPLETADQTAVIAARDREIFLRTLQELAVREDLNFSVSRKDASKNRRR